MNDPLVFGLVVAILVGLIVVVDRVRRRPPPGETEATMERAVVDAVRDRQKTDAVEAKEFAGHQWPGGSL
jgi:acid phosphatase family membrane protein YuiD